MFNLDTIKLFYDDCRLLVTFENSLDQDQVTVLCVCMYVCLSVCLSFCACTHICLSSHWRRLIFNRALSLTAGVSTHFFDNLP